MDGAFEETMNELIGAQRSVWNATETFLGPLTTLPPRAHLPRVVQAAIPMFVLMLVLEAIFTAKHKRHTFADSLSSLTGVFRLLPARRARTHEKLRSAALPFFGARAPGSPKKFSWTAGSLQNLWLRASRTFVPLIPYAYVYEHYRIIDLPLEHWLTALACFAVVDFLYYLGHRLSHSNTFIWSGHIVHHSSEFYNFTTALRQGYFEGLLMWPRLLILAMLGFPPAYGFFWNELNIVMMFFVHTETIGKLPAPIEFVFNTPSHHRVHHARNPKYIDKNYAGVFIIWDRLLGTYEEEAEAPVYGLVHPLHTYDPLFVQFSHLQAAVSDVLATKSASIRLQKLFCGPGTYFDDQSETWKEHEIPSVAHVREKEFQADVSGTMRSYVFAQFVIFLAMAIFASGDWHFSSAWEFLSACALVTYTAVVIAQLTMANDNYVAEKASNPWRRVPLARNIWRFGDQFEPYARRAELTRWGVTLLAVSMLPSASTHIRLAASVAAACSLLAIFALTDRSSSSKSKTS